MTTTIEEDGDMRTIRALTLATLLALPALAAATEEVPGAPYQCQQLIANPYLYQTTCYSAGFVTLVAFSEEAPALANGTWTVKQVTIDSLSCKLIPDRSITVGLDGCSVQAPREPRD